MLTFSKNDATKGNLASFIAIALMSALGIRETLPNSKGNGGFDFAISHPLIAVAKFVRSLGNAETAANRQAAIAKAVESGVDKAKAEKDAKAGIKREGERRDVEILNRLAKGEIHLTYKMENRLASLLRDAAKPHGFNGRVTREDLDESFALVVKAIAESADVVSVSWETFDAPAITAKDELKAAKGKQPEAA